jgi:hypothetical protein
VEGSCLKKEGEWGEADDLVLWANVTDLFVPCLREGLGAKPTNLRRPDRQSKFRVRTSRLERRLPLGPPKILAINRH